MLRHNTTLFRELHAVVTRHQEKPSELSAALGFLLASSLRQMCRDPKLDHLYVDRFLAEIRHNVLANKRAH